MTKTSTSLALLPFGLLFGGLLLGSAIAVADDLEPTASPQDEEAVVQLPMAFETPDAAAMALIDAAAEEGRDALYAVLGSDLDAFLSGDPVADAADRQRFVELSQKAADLEGETADSAILVIGPDHWPFPIPLAKGERGWSFDTLAGIDELLDRRIGLNELYAIATARAFVDAQLEYAAADPDGDGIASYAARFWSTEGKRDGLYWPTSDGEPESPMGPRVAEAEDEGYAIGEAADGLRPYHGYYYRILTAQGPNAPGGAMSYLVDGRLSGGFGVLAWPARYGHSGIMSFQVNQRGVVYQADLGEETQIMAAAIDGYDPGDGWEVVVD